ncbi:MAG: tetratricopeptide repeat protein, partial [Isosphaeraceae bacterium]
AAKSFRQAAELKPESAVYNYHLGVMLATTGKPAKAIEYYRRAAEADGDKPGLAILALGAALVRANKLPEAACVFERATRNDHKNDRAFNELGKVQWSLGRYDDAAKSFRQAAKLDPKNAVYNYHLGVMLETTGWPAEAIEYYRRAAEADGDQLGLAIWAFGDALIGVRRYKEAVETFEKAVRIIRKGHPDGHPDHLRALLGLGLAHGLADDSAGAEDDLLAASRLVRQHFRSLAAGSPTDDAWVALAGDSKAAAAMARGIAEGKAGRLDEALKAFAEAEKQDPGAAAIAVFNRAVARSKAKPVDPAATADFQRAWLLYREAVRDGAGRQTRRPGRSGRVPIQGAVDNPGEAPASGRSRVRPVRYQAGETPRTGAGQDAKVPGVPIATAEQKKPEPPKPPPLHTPDPPAPTAPDKLSGGVEQTQPLVRDIKALKAWLQRWNDCGVEKPQLVVVCTSGGGIAAAYWTTLCLAELEEKVPKFPSHLRLVTGSSGGMLGAGLYVASLEAPDQPNQPKPEDRLRDLKGVWKNCDFLTPVVRQMVFRDLPSTFCTKELMPPYFKKDGDIQDRGRTLEEQWESICVGTSLKGRLSHSFAELAAGERAGWRPSLVVTPTIVELGRRLLISNLDFRSSDQGTLCNSIQFFTLFPDRADIRRSGAQIARQKVVESLRLSTAIRMNAAFPIITPVLPLPVKSPRIRAADAGYLENYGVELAAAWIERNREWLVEETGGVTLIEIRAYTEKLKQEVERNPGRKSDGQAKAGAAEKTWWESLIAGAQGLCDPLTHPDARGLEVLTTPFETYTTARKAAMIGNNDAQVTRLQAYFAKETKDKDPPFFEKFVLICTEEAPLGWSLTPRARKRIDESLKNDELQQIIKDIADRLKP